MQHRQKLANVETQQREEKYETEKKRLRYEKWSLFSNFFIIFFIRLHLHPFLQVFFFVPSFIISCKCVKFLSQFCLNSLNFHFICETWCPSIYQAAGGYTCTVYMVCTCQVNRKIKTSKYDAAPTINLLRSRLSPHIAETNWIGNRRYDETINGIRDGERMVTKFFFFFI